MKGPMSQIIKSMLLFPTITKSQNIILSCLQVEITLHIAGHTADTLSH